MKIKCGRSADKTQWHNWFAWYPVKVSEGDFRWLEVVERKGALHYDFVAGDWVFEYRGKKV